MYSHRDVEIRHWAASFISLTNPLSPSTGRGGVLHWRSLLWQHQPFYQPPVRPQHHPGASVHAAPGSALPPHRLLQLAGHPHRAGVRVRQAQDIQHRCLFPKFPTNRTDAHDTKSPGSKAQSGIITFVGFIFYTVFASSLYLSYPNSYNQGQSSVLRSQKVETRTRTFFAC